MLETKKSDESQPEAPTGRPVADLFMHFDSVAAAFANSQGRKPRFIQIVTHTFASGVLTKNASEPMPLELDATGNDHAHGAGETVPEHAIAVHCFSLDDGEALAQSTEPSKGRSPKALWELCASRVRERITCKKERDDCQMIEPCGHEAAAAADEQRRG